MRPITIRRCGGCSVRGYHLFKLTHTPTDLRAVRKPAENSGTGKHNTRTHQHRRTRSEGGSDTRQHSEHLPRELPNHFIVGRLVLCYVKEGYDWLSKQLKAHVNANAWQTTQSQTHAQSTSGGGYGKGIRATRPTVQNHVDRSWAIAFSRAVAGREGLASRLAQHCSGDGLICVQRTAALAQSLLTRSVSGIHAVIVTGAHDVKCRGKRWGKWSSHRHMQGKITMNRILPLTGRCLVPQKRDAWPTATADTRKVRSSAQNSSEDTDFSQQGKGER